MIIKGQVIASTGLDHHGDRIPEEQLRKLFTQMPDNFANCVQHDQGKKPIGRSFNHALERLPDGELAIVCDMEVWDEEALSQLGGVSISYVESTYTMRPNDSRVADIIIQFNPKVIDKDEVFELVHLTNDELTIDAEVLVQKALSGPLMIIVSFATLEFFSGFFKAIGQDAYKVIKQRIIDWGKSAHEQHGQSLKCQLKFEWITQQSKSSIFVSVSSADLDSLNDRGIDEKMIEAELCKHCELGRIKRASLALKNGEPMWTVEYIMDHNDRLVDLQTL